MFPLRHKSVVSMRKMQEIQPEAKAIQDRYAKLKATDPAKQKMNQELMGLYKERGVNPASGCIPMLLTMPVLFAFYSLLSTAIELRGAPFFAWIHDLSAPDPFYVTPVLMGASQFWQTKMTPQTGVDPAQQKMMMFMPLIFTGFSLWFPVRRGALLAREQRVGHRADLPHELLDWSAERPHGSTSRPNGRSSASAPGRPRPRALTPRRRTRPCRMHSPSSIS